MGCEKRMVRCIDAASRVLPSVSKRRAENLVRHRQAKVVGRKPYTIQLIDVAENTEELLRIYQTVRYIRLTKEISSREAQEEVVEGITSGTVRLLMKEGVLHEDDALKEQIAYLKAAIAHVDGCLDDLKSNSRTAASYDVIKQHYLMPQGVKHNRKSERVKRAIRDLDRLLWESDGKEME